MGSCHIMISRWWRWHHSLRSICREPPMKHEVLLRWWITDAADPKKPTVQVFMLLQTCCITWSQVTKTRIRLRSTAGALCMTKQTQVLIAKWLIQHPNQVIHLLDVVPQSVPEHKKLKQLLPLLLHNVKNNFCKQVATPWIEDRVHPKPPSVREVSNRPSMDSGFGHWDVGVPWLLQKYECANCWLLLSFFGVGKLKDWKLHWFQEIIGKHQQHYQCADCWVVDCYCLSLVLETLGIGSCIDFMI